MLTTFQRQYEIAQLLREEIKSRGLSVNAQMKTTAEEVDLALNDIGGSISAMKRYQEMEEVPNKRAISLIEKLVERLEKFSDASPIKDEATNYVISFKR